MTYVSVVAAHDALEAALRAASAALPADERFTVLTELAGQPDPPAAILAPPALRWDGPTGYGPREASWITYLVVPVGDRFVAELYRLLPTVVNALEGPATDAVVSSAEPGVYRAGSTELPAYLITAEVAL